MWRLPEYRGETRKSQRMTKTFWRMKWEFFWKSWENFPKVGKIFLRLWNFLKKGNSERGGKCIIGFGGMDAPEYYGCPEGLVFRGHEDIKALLFLVLLYDLVIVGADIRFDFRDFCLTCTSYPTQLKWVHGLFTVIGKMKQLVRGLATCPHMPRLKQWSRYILHNHGYQLLLVILCLVLLNIMRVCSYLVSVQRSPCCQNLFYR